MILINAQISKLFTLHLKTLRYFGPYPYHRDIYNERLLFNKNCKSEKLKTLVLFVVLVITWIQIYHGRLYFSTAVTLENMVYAGAEVAFVTANFIYFRHSNEICELFNKLITLEVKLLSSEQDLSSHQNLTVTLIRIVQLCAATSAPICIASECIRLWFQPCSPFLPGYFLLPECSKELNIFSNIFALTFRTFACLFLLVILLSTTGAYLFVNMQMMFIQAWSLRSLLAVINSSIKNFIALRRVYWVMNVKDKFKLFATYRELEIVLILYNNVHQDVIAPLAVTFSSYAMVISLYALVQQQVSLNALQIMILVCITIDGFLVIALCFGNMGQLYANSLDVLTLFQTKFLSAQTNNMGFMKRSLRSLRPLSVKLGYVSIVDKLTAINVLNVCVTALVNLLLLK